jgi:hydrogenase/urease accessory protein HupE
MRRMCRTARLCWPTLLVGLLFACPAARAHPLIEDALDAIVSPEKLTVELRVAPEELSVAAGTSASQPPSAEVRRAHAAYVARHLRVEADGRSITPSATGEASASAGPLIAYRLEYSFPRPPQVVRLEQTLLADHPPWAVSCVLRFRQRDQPAFQTGLLAQGQIAEFGCDWAAAASTSAPSQPLTDTARTWATFRAYAAHGVMHILTGYDHLLFVSALVLAAGTFWELVKVVTAFTVAHTLTLTLAVLGLVHLGARVVEPMIAASIVLVSLQNILWPRGSQGWSRLTLAFAFGLFHGLGFAGGLRDAMADLPRMTLVVALIGFSLGVELGHQAVVLPLFGSLAMTRRRIPAPYLSRGWYRCASGAICGGGLFFFVRALC